jgi:integrase
MAYTVTKPGKNGDRHTAMYWRAGTALSAGTYSDKDEALAIAVSMERYDPTSNRMSPQQMATMTITEFVPVFLRLHSVDPITKRSYASTIRCHIEPFLGKARVRELTMQDCREWLADLLEGERSPDTMKRARIVFSAMMRMAVQDGYRDDNPVKELKTPKRTQGAITVMTVEQFESVYAQLPTQGAKVMARLAVLTGMRFGEFTALRVRDLDLVDREASITKAISDVGRDWNPTSDERFRINPHTKNGTHRTVALTTGITQLVADYIAANGLGPDDLLFRHDLVIPEGGIRLPKNREPLTQERLDEMGTFVAANGVTYQHGTMNGYTTGKCKCDGCKQAISIYSAAKRTERNKGKKRRRPVTQPRGATLNPEGIIGRDAWGRVWGKAVAAAGLPFKPTAYQVRHTNASWLINKNLDPKTVMERLGQNDLRVTSRYVHRIGTDRPAADILEDMLG